MPMQRLHAILDAGQIRYQRIIHSNAYTAQEVAAAAHISGQNMAKSVMVKLDGKMAMVVLPASNMINFNLLRKATGAGVAELAVENEFRDIFPGCEVGAMPPFGNLFGVVVYVDDSLAGCKEIAFNDGSHTELIRMSYSDFVRLVNPIPIQLAAPKTH